MTEYNTLFVNIFGGPGSGKSTAAAGLFHRLRTAGILAELVTEYAKDVCWAEQFELLHNQALISGEQLRRHTIISGKVAVAVVDSPILLSAFWAERRGWPGLGKDLCRFARSLRSINFRLPPPVIGLWEPTGRNENFKRALDIHMRLAQYLEAKGEVCSLLQRDYDDVDFMYDEVLNALAPMNVVPV